MRRRPATGAAETCVVTDVIGLIFGLVPFLLWPVLIIVVIVAWRRRRRRSADELSQTLSEIAGVLSDVRSRLSQTEQRLERLEQRQAAAEAPSTRPWVCQLVASHRRPPVTTAAR